MPATYTNEKPAKTMPVLIFRSAVISVLSTLAAMGYIQVSKVGISVSTRIGLMACSYFTREQVSLWGAQQLHLICRGLHLPGTF